MKRIIGTFLLSALYFWIFTAGAFGAVKTTALAGEHFITVSIDELSPGYYVGAIWHGDELLTLFDYTVGNDGRMETVINVGMVLNGDSSLKLGISGGNGEAAAISCRVPVGDSHNNTGGSSGYDDHGDSGNDSSYESYKIILIGKTSGGQVTVNMDRASEGSLVSMMIIPDKEYALAELSVRDVSGNRVKITNVDNVKYTFKMPNNDVHIEAEFRQSIKAAVELSFTDIQADNWYYEGVQYVYARGLMTGESYALFGPHTKLKRAMLAEILYRMEESPEVWQENVFIDTANDAWYAKALAWANQNGIIRGYENGRFMPWQNVTREEMAVIIKRYADYKGYKFDVGSYGVKYSDENRVSDWAWEAMGWAAECGIISGTENNALAPGGSVSRAEAAVILMRFCGQLGK